MLSQIYSGKGGELIKQRQPARDFTDLLLVMEMYFMFQE
jgi:hypothetical protein